MRSIAAVAALLVLLSALAACGAEEPARSSGDGEPAADSSAFPVTIEHRLGETVVEAVPERVVSIGVTEQDILLQLGIVPVGVTEWHGEQPEATWPWAHDLLDGAQPEVLHTSDGFEIEKIAALEPDLIVGPNAGLTKQDYALLSQIAPTISSSPGSTRWFSPWRDQVLLVARAVGQEAQGQQIIDDLAAGYADVILFATESAEMFEELMDFSTVPSLGAVAEGRAVYTDEVMAGAVYFSTPLSLEYLLDRLTPMLEAAVAGEAPRAYPS